MVSVTIGTVLAGCAAAFALLAVTQHIKFTRKWRRCKARIHEASAKTEGVVERNRITTEHDLAHLPKPVVRWLTWSQVVGKSAIREATLEQRGRLRLSRGSSWLPFTATQCISCSPTHPGFIWRVHVPVFMKGLISMVGIDTCLDGKGSMEITLSTVLSAINVAPNPKTNQSALQRLLGELCWVPASVPGSRCIAWGAVEGDENAATATMDVEGTIGTATFFFNADGSVKKFIAMRYKEVTDKQPTPFEVDVESTESLMGFESLRGCAQAGACQTILRHSLGLKWKS